MTVQNVSGDAKSGFGEELADTVTEPVDNPSDQPADGDTDDDADNSPGGDQPVDPASEGDNPDH